MIEKPTDEPLFRPGKGMQIIPNTINAPVVNPTKQLIQDRLEGARKNFERKAFEVGDNLGIPQDRIRQIQSGFQSGFTQVGQQVQQVVNPTTYPSTPGQRLNNAGNSFSYRINSLAGQYGLDMNDGGVLLVATTVLTVMFLMVFWMLFRH